ncbi:uncharacterized protein LOC113377969 isoform X2 [Ctenocephalides felis]|uniref:uncharacterized protein LOC113377969 isoform X2 n=1 Tax=Ctenocephalides felis TaxID=7515 RepID=UPI000E6E4D3B|nr:uncharacterized protein LOC113377969 isoform X2 [Ctenocephalides felis]
MDFKFKFVVFALCLCSGFCTKVDDDNEPPAGYYAFVESPQAQPPGVRPPPYTHADEDCRDAGNTKPFVSAHNLCGDLNKGVIPRNPMHKNVMGDPYPFELIRNQTLRFLSRTLPILKADELLPKITQMQESEEPLEPEITHGPINRSAKNIREPKKFCDGGGVFCALYRAIQGEPASRGSILVERRDEPVHDAASGAGASVRYEGPPTPCPAKVEYATPVFAKNYQGAWRYVVQIPYEGYFTQTVEITKCLQARCHYLDGGCLSSPRWVSLLVAEIFYPQNEEPLSATTSTPPVQDFQAYQQYLQKRAVGNQESANAKQTHCDGQDEIGCFQVRLYYDWFLIPGSCKCWRPDYFTRYMRKKNNGADL